MSTERCLAQEGSVSPSTEQHRKAMDKSCCALCAPVVSGMSACEGGPGWGGGGLKTIKA